jgi:hypothetical protein
LALTGRPHHAYFSDTILLWCPLVPAFAAIFVERCADMIGEALSMGIPLRGAVTLGDAVLDEKTSTYIGKPIVEAAMLEKGQDWIDHARELGVLVAVSRSATRCIYNRIRCSDEGGL